MKDERKPVGWGFWLQWVLANIVGFSVGFGLGKVLAVALGGQVGTDAGGGPVFGLGGGAVQWGVFGAVAGTMHWLLLRQKVSWARWWLVGFTVFFALFGAVMGAVFRSQSQGGQAGIGASWIGVDAILGFLFGVITGIPLLWLLRRRSGRGAEQRDGV